MDNESKLRKFFKSDKVLKVSVVVSVICLILNIVCKYTLKQYTLCISDICFVLCIVYLFKAFKAHNKNVQKGLLGAVLMWYLVDKLSYVLNGIVFSNEFENYNNFSGIAYIALGVITLLLFACFFINHFLIVSDHEASPESTWLSTVLAAVLVITYFAMMLFRTPILWPSPAQLSENFTWHIGIIAFFIMIGCYEMHFESWREKREEKNND